MSTRLEKIKFLRMLAASSMACDKEREICEDLIEMLVEEQETSAEAYERELRFEDLDENIPRSKT
jgi:hypothetical protein